MVKTLMGLCQSEPERKRNFRSLIYYESLILFDYMFSSLPLAILTIIEAIGYGAFLEFNISSYVSIFCMIKFVGVSGAAFINCKILFFEIYGIYKQSKPKSAPPETRNLVNTVNSSNSTIMTTGSIQTATPTTASPPPKTTFQQKVESARQRGDKAEVNRLREVGDVGYVQNTMRQLEKAKGDRTKSEAIIDEEIKKYDTIYRSRLYTAKTLKDNEEEAHVVALYEQTSNKLRNLREQFLN